MTDPTALSQSPSVQAFQPTSPETASSGPSRTASSVAESSAKTPHLRGVTEPGAANPAADDVGKSRGAQMDPHVFRRIYESEFRPVWHTLRRFGVPEKDLEDAAHEVFVVLHRRYVDFDQSRPIRPWLMGIAYRTASDFRNRASARIEVVEDKDETPDHRVAKAEANQDQTVDEKRRRALVHSALKLLDDDRRTVFVLHELEGYSIPEVHDLLDRAGQNVPLNTLYSRLRLAREQFTAHVRRLQVAQNEAADAQRATLDSGGVRHGEELI
ncbi:MAG: sigma-70 family RNA polymerase sigma factor [Deltaproteobacteria bacterium]|nr:sigma-70 family RNA polymerase sigma factor [Deltaproteobacteria bacterium]